MNSPMWCSRGARRRRPVPHSSGKRPKQARRPAYACPGASPALLRYRRSTLGLQLANAPKATLADVQAALRDEVKNGHISGFPSKIPGATGNSEIFVLSIIFQVASHNGRKAWGTEFGIIADIDWPKPGGKAPRVKSGCASTSRARRRPNSLALAYPASRIKALRTRGRH